MNEYGGNTLTRDESSQRDRLKRSPKRTLGKTTRGKARTSWSANGFPNKEPIAFVRFTGGAMRPVYEDERGQFVIDNDGNRVDGMWYISREECDEPIVVGDDERPPDW